MGFNSAFKGLNEVRSQWRNLELVDNHSSPQKAGSFSTRRGRVTFSRETLFCVT